ncbi:hypothetical protein NESM_000424600 [Novymonas esmeraldas]|uniref:MYND-type domain-containing protein n=1 Tax=Novymonas esmeraldas TaxID=1808958 RepID=A0AAW0ENR7_9TRYP
MTTTRPAAAAATHVAHKSVHVLHREGNELFEARRFAEAAQVFRAAVDCFHADRTATAAAVEEYVAVAGNLCVCHHSTGDWHTCVKTARELLSIYPIIPKAYAAIGMCIVNRLLEQEAEREAAEAQCGASVPPRSGEDVRRDARRYVVKLGGVVCSPDDAHTYLCRAILLSDGALQIALGPYVETAVRWVSEQLLSAGLSLEREYGEGVLGELSALEDSVCDAPPRLDVAPVHVDRRPICVLDAADMHGGAPVTRRIEELLESDASAILQALEERADADAGEPDTAATNVVDTPSVGAAASPPIDFLVSGQPTRVRVCHAERGGIPRGLTLARASRPIAVGQHAHPSPAGDTPASTAPLAHHQELVPVHVDPAGGHDAGDSVAGLATLSASLALLGNNGGGGGGHVVGGVAAASEAPPLLMCNACGREVNPLQLTGPPPTGCATCHGVVYCSAACEGAYRERHVQHECALRLALQHRVDVLAAAPPPSPDAVAPLPAGDVLPGGGWDVLDLHRRTLPLCIAVYSGMRCDAAGTAAVWAQVRRGVQRGLRHALPPEVAETLAAYVRAAESVEPTAPTAAAASAAPASVHHADDDDGSGGRHSKRVADPPRDHVEAAGCAGMSLEQLFLALFFTTRLFAVDHAESRCGGLYAERLLLRHSCEPNCLWSDTLRGLLTARFICKGEELTVAADDRFPQHWPLQVRQKWFLHHHGAPCQCARCEREAADLHHGRGMLSNELVEKLLTADIIDHPCPTPAHRYPTHMFHRQVQRLVEQSRSPQLRNVPALLRRIDDVRAEVCRHVLPSHYLLEDLRRATLNVAEAEGHLATCTADSQASLLFWEAHWAGAIPAKVQQLRLLPSVFECGRRRKVHPSQQRRRRRHAGPPAAASAVAASPSSDAVPERRRGSTSPPPAGIGRGADRSSPPAQRTAGVSDSDDAASKGRAASSTAVPRTPASVPLVATKDFASGRNIIDLFYGSYQTWYA